MSARKAGQNTNSVYTIERQDLNSLFSAIQKKGYKTVGPTVKHGAIVYDAIKDSSDLPAGWTDEQNGGTYRIRQRGDSALFGFASSPHSWKKYLHPAVSQIFHAKRNGGSFDLSPQKQEDEKLAFIGVRSCDLHAISILDKVFTGGPYKDSAYASRRANVLIVALNCGHAGATCFCASMNTGPKVSREFDIALTEIYDRKRHYFLAETGSGLGASIMKDVRSGRAGAEELAAGERVLAKTASNMGRSVEAEGLRPLLYRNYENPRWQETAKRCLSCTNCTMVCPTCFCTTVEDTTDLTGKEAYRMKKWDSCFTMEFSYIHGGSVRSSVMSRYRQWLVHKFAAWIDQFGTSGCVGCGRCITWCPVGIDVTEELNHIKQHETKPPSTISIKEK